MREREERFFFAEVCMRTYIASPNIHIKNEMPILSTSANILEAFDLYYFEIELLPSPPTPQKSNA